MATKFTYTPEELEQIIADYTAGALLDELSTKYGKSIPSLRMKLVHAGVYVKGTSTKTSALPTQPAQSGASSPNPRENTPTNPRTVQTYKPLYTPARILSSMTDGLHIPFGYTPKKAAKTELTDTQNKQLQRDLRDLLGEPPW